MAVLVEAISVIVKRSSIAEKYPGGWDAFVEAVPNRTLCADAEIARVGFMAPDDTEGFCNQLDLCGLAYVENGEAQDLVVADQQRGFAAKCSWAEFGHIPFGPKGEPVAACRFRGSECMHLITPDGWKFEGSMSERFTFVPTEEVFSRMKHVVTEDGVDVYVDKRTGEKKYVGRVKPKGKGILTTSDRVSLWLGKSKAPEFEEKAARVCAAMWNTLAPSVLEPFLAEDVRYESQSVMEPMIGKTVLMRYLRGKMDTLRRGLPNTRIFAEMGLYQGHPCLVTAQGRKEDLQGVILFKVADGKITGIDLCSVVPRPEDVERFGIYPESVVVN